MKVKSFEERRFERHLLSLERRTRNMAERPPLDLPYTLLICKLTLLLVVVPFLSGAACALLFGPLYTG